MQIFVTGGAGYIGSVLVRELLSGNHDVTVLDNFMYSEPSLADCCWNPKLQLVTGDVRDLQLIRRLISEADVVIPLAAIVGAPACDRDPALATAINHDSTLALFEFLREDQVILMPTTNSAYGSGGQDNYCDETSELRPLSHYAKEKVAIEQALMSNRNAVSFRLATVFGLSPRMRLDLLVNNFVWRALQDRSIVLFESHFKRNYIHVRDVAAAFVLALDHLDDFVGEIFNVGLSAANISKLELCEMISSHVPDLTTLEAPFKKDPDQRNYIVSNAKIEARGFAPQFDLDRGIAELVKGLPMYKIHRYGNA